MSTLILVIASAMLSNSVYALPALGATSAANTSNMVQKANTFREDSRQDLDDLSAPWTTVGKLWLPGSGSCTASLVGPDLILTNAHCVVENGELVLGDYKFQLYLHGKKHYGSAAVKRIWVGGDPVVDRANDWAILRISQRLGDEAGWLGTQSVTDEEMVRAHEKVKVFEIGYSNDYKGGLFPAWQKGCRFFPAPHGYFYHNCSGTSGSSGSPMFYEFSGGGGNTRIIAIDSEERRNGAKTSVIGVPYSEEYANIAIPASKFQPRLKEIMSQTSSR